MAMNENFQKAAAAVKTLNSKGNSMWGALVAFALDASTNGASALKDNFKIEERLAAATMRVEMGKNSTYKVAKSVIVRATEMGIPLVDKDGKARGKTDVEADIKLGKEEKSASEKFKVAMNTATSIAAKLEAKDIPVAAGLVKELLEKITGALELKAAA
jgi:hypothetical protein